MDKVNKHKIFIGLLFSIILVLSAWNYSLLKKDSLKPLSGNIIEDKINMSGEYKKAKEKYKQLDEKYRYAVNPPFIIANNRTFILVFNDSKKNIRKWLFDAKSLENQIILGNIVRKLTKKQMITVGWKKIADQFKGDTKFKQYGNLGNYYQIAPFITPDVFEPIAFDIFKRYKTDQAKIREVWKYVTQITAYSSDIKETPRYPLETLLLGGGDCEDLTFVAASILKAMPVDWNIYVVLMDKNSPKEPKKIDHSLIFVETKNYSTFIEVTNSENMAPYKKINGIFVKVS